MTEYKKITEKQVWLIMKTWFGGKIEFVGAYWHEDTASRVAANNLPLNGQTFGISLHEITLHGLAIDVK